MKLVQKQFLKGTREFEIIDDMVFVRIKGLIKEEKLTVGLAMLNPAPVINGSELEFHGRGKQGPLLSLYLNNPNAEQFSAFVDALKQRLATEDFSLAGTPATSTANSLPEAPGWNVYDEPPAFDEPGEDKTANPGQTIYPDRLAEDITMLKTYLDENDIRPLLDSLEALKAEPQSETAFKKVSDAFDDLGFHQGAVLTYAPYLKVLLSHSLF